ECGEGHGVLGPAGGSAGGGHGRGPPGGGGGTRVFGGEKRGVARVWGGGGVPPRPPSPLGGNTALWPAGGARCGRVGVPSGDRPRGRRGTFAADATDSR